MMLIDRVRSGVTDRGWACHVHTTRDGYVGLVWDTQGPHPVGYAEVHVGCANGDVDKMFAEAEAGAVRIGYDLKTARFAAGANSGTSARIGRDLSPDTNDSAPMHAIDEGTKSAQD